MGVLITTCVAQSLTYDNIQVFLATVTAHKDSPALKVKRTKGWATWTYNQYYNDCSTAAKAFIKLGTCDVTINLNINVSIFYIF